VSDVARGRLTGLPLSHFATAELVARAHEAGFVNLWDYIDALEWAISEEGIWHHVKPAGSYTCPRCGMTSYNPNDARESYCGNCHDWTAGG